VIVSGALCLQSAAALDWQKGQLAWAVPFAAAPAVFDASALLARGATGLQVAARLRIAVPQDDAELLIDGRVTAGVGTLRDVQMPPLEPGIIGEYKLSVTWRPNSYTVVTRSTTVRIASGDVVDIDLTTENATDRVQIRYVPTPSHVVTEMIALAQVQQEDVVFEPGCGDARLTIAAVKAGATRGVGIDLDPERVDESRKNVSEAGLERKIEIRLGDAMDIPDLSTATVVFLYMGDEFHQLIRPILRQQLPVGARIVSHRFTMGDWAPDKSVSLPDEAGNTDLHLWTITPADKVATSKLPGALR
jgi:uncharacterized protein (TIGR03000 family)